MVENPTQSAPRDDAGLAHSLNYMVSALFFLVFFLREVVEKT